MNNFGKLKTIILSSLTESYSKGDKDAVKKTLKLLKENKDFRELYLFYEEIENMYIPDKQLAERYVDQVEVLLKEKIEKVKGYCKTLSEQFNGEGGEEIELYNNLDVLMEENTLKNVDKKILGRKQLVDFLTTKKNVNESVNVHTNNEHLLHFVLAERFNNDFEKMLNEEEKLQLNKILSMSSDELVSEFNTLKEEVVDKLDNVISEENDDTLKTKLTEAQTEAGKMKVSKYNYYKLQQLRNGL
jgi:nitrogen regulatory protein PII-like uncharacterized protein